ncbi:tyrosine-type recombinase/integrase [Xanthomonas axonopodis]
MKLSKKLSPSIIEGCKPEAAPYRLWDTNVPQLHLRVQPSGIKSWNVQWSRTSTRALGKWPGVTVESARAKAKAILVETDRLGAPLAVVEANKPKASTLREFIEGPYTSWAKGHLKDSAANIKALEVSWGHLYDKPMEAITATDVEKWKGERLSGRNKPATVNREVTRLRGVISRAVEWDLLPSHPLRAVKRVKTDDDDRVRYLSKDEEARLRASLAKRDNNAREARKRADQWRAERGRAPFPALDYADHLTPAVLISINTGLRRGELTSLRWTDIDMTTRVLTVRAAAAKSRKGRHIPLNDEAISTLQRWENQTDDAQRVFPFADAKKAWGAVLADAKIKEFRWHDLRHHFASRLVQAGVNLNIVRELLGHSDLKMTLRYAHLAPDNTADAVRRIG